MDGFSGGEPLSNNGLQIYFVPRVGFLRGHPINNCLAVGFQMGAHIQVRHVVSLFDERHSRGNRRRAGANDNNHNRRTVIMDSRFVLLDRERSMLPGQLMRKS